MSSRPGIYASSRVTNVLWLPCDTSLEDKSLFRSTVSTVGNTSVTLSTEQPLDGSLSAKFDRNYLAVTPSRPSSPFVLSGDFLVHGFVYSLHDRAAPPGGGDPLMFNTILSVGDVSDGILIRPSSYGKDEIFVNGIIVLQTTTPFLAKGVWTYFALWRQRGTVGFHTAVRDANNQWVVTAWPLSNNNQAATTNPTGRAVYVGASFHRPDERFLGYMDQIRVERRAPRSTLAVPFV